MKSGHNLILSIYKLIFASVVLCYHGLSPLVFTSFSPNGVYAVCFFFLCIGYYLYDNLVRFLSRKESFPAVRYPVSRVRKFGVPFYICVAFAFIIYVANFSNTRGILHYLWFIEFIVLFESVSLLLIKHLKKRTLSLIMLFMFLSASLLKGMEWLGITGHLPNEVLGFISIPSGYFLSLIKERLKPSKKAVLPLALITPVCLYLLLFTDSALSGLITVYFLIPAVFVSIIVLNLLCSRPFIDGLIAGLSLWLYIYQEIPRSLSEIFSISQMREFHIVFILTLMTALFHIADYFVRKKKEKSAQCPEKGGKLS